jgi:hypothetical protein
LSKMDSSPSASGTLLLRPTTSIALSTFGNMKPFSCYRRCLVSFLVAGACSALLKAPASAQPATQAARILVVGDSLSAEYGLARNTGWVEQLNVALAKATTPATVIGRAQRTSIQSVSASGFKTAVPRGRTTGAFPGTRNNPRQGAGKVRCRPAKGQDAMPYPWPTERPPFPQPAAPCYSARPSPGGV